MTKQIVEVSKNRMYRIGYESGQDAAAHAPQIRSDTVRRPLSEGLTWRAGYMDGLAAGFARRLEAAYQTQPVIHGGVWGPGGQAA